MTSLTHKHMETHGCILSTVLKHQAISILSADKAFTALDQFHTRISYLLGTMIEDNISFKKKPKKPPKQI